MPRSARHDFPDARHHVMNRGARRDPIFVGDDSCALFIGLLAQLPERFGVRVHAYALMPNHYHLLLQTPRANLSDAMRFLGGEYTQRLNRLHPGWDGPVFRGRFRSSLVLDDAYWQHLLAYVHLNPVRAHLVGEPEQSQWTSHAAYVGLAPKPEWLCCDDLLAQFGSVGALRRYVHEVQVGRLDPPEGFDPDALWGPPSRELAPPPDPPAFLTVPEALEQACAVMGTTLEQLRAQQRGRGGHKARWVAVWWLTHAAGLSQGAAGAQFGLSRANVAKTLARVRTTAEPDVRRWRQDLLEQWSPPEKGNKDDLTPPGGGAKRETGTT